MYALAKPLLFQFDPERGHDMAMSMLAAASRRNWSLGLLHTIYGRRVTPLPFRLMGIDFPNPVGLAAGLDKQANAGAALGALGFGSVELGTVTPLPQPGNPRPRMFRLTLQQAVINRMGFNSIGLSGFLANLAAMPPGVIRGINIGKNAATPVDQAAADYLACLDAVHPWADYVAINISSPNTQNLRSLQEDRALDALLEAIVTRAEALHSAGGRQVPLVLKVAPDLDQSQISAIATLVRRHGIDAVAATNTTVSRSGVEGAAFADETGGLSGPPVRNLANQVISGLHADLGREVPIIGIGGIDSAEAALEKLAAGASLLQLYTGLVYHGPGLIATVVNGLARACRLGGHGSDYAGWLEALHGYD
jgi:dihydroorotate dehydrogenase